MDAVEAGVELLAAMDDDTLSVADAVDRLEAVTTHPEKTRRILDEAESRGIIDRDGSEVTFNKGGYGGFDPDIVTKEGDFTCRRCGTGISTGYFLNLETGELGPFGSSCVRKVTGRE
ncbi:DUF5830 family protein [Salarchaeum sp. JOR-1]|uniref:DUF5830 family protein n=1 Tax=Salarchaeum sp. JOR-1 TaxID=2599399 RepID=UPI0011984251|nr:DUF5830 family protein [Salarchaeum sp. JOR-1]QDX40606.1 MarR family transcriptional regulator [Salarchaeum sp. JOR-1]